MTDVPTPNEYERMEDNISSRDHAPSDGGTRADGGVPKVGDFIVRSGGWKAAEVAGPISKITALRVYHPSTYRMKREEFTDLRAVLFAGAEDTAKWLCEQIVSSRALAVQETAGANRRHESRVQTAIEKALSAATESPAEQQLQGPGRTK